MRRMSQLLPQPCSRKRRVDLSWYSSCTRYGATISNAGGIVPLYKHEYSRPHSSSIRKAARSRAASKIIQTSRFSPRGQRTSSIAVNDWFVITEIGAVSMILRQIITSVNEIVKDPKTWLTALLLGSVRMTSPANAVKGKWRDMFSGMRHTVKLALQLASGVAASCTALEIRAAVPTNDNNIRPAKHTTCSQKGTT